MHRKLRTVITSAALVIPMFAHGGFDHVMGTIAKVERRVMTVKTENGDVAVKVGAKTALTKDGKKAKLEDLVPGARVVVDLPEKVKDPVAASVKIGVVEQAAPAHEHADHK